MVLLIQRTEGALLCVVDDNGQRSDVGQIHGGIVVYIGFAVGDDEGQFDKWTDKLINIRIFEDGSGKMNRSVRDTAQGIMVIPNFTLAGNMKKGNRPSFDSAMAPSEAHDLFIKFVKMLRHKYPEVVSGIFGADMRIEQKNSGPVNIIL